MSRQHRLVLVVSVLASFVPFMDGAIVNVALPAIQHELGGGLAAQQWIVDAYLLTLSSLILVAGSLSDLLGRKRILAVGLIGFGFTSVLCAVAPSSTALIVFRGLQGLGGALIVPSSLAIIMSSLPKNIQGKAIGSWTAWTGIAFVIGPLAGGLLVDYANWRWIFGINVLPILLTLYLLKQIKSTETDVRTRIDVTGAVLCAIGLGGLIFGLIEQSHYGWSDPLIYGSIIGGLVLLAGFLWYEKGLDHAMLPLSLFKNRNFSVGNIATLCVYAGLSAATFLIVLFLQQVAGYSALAAGLALLPVTIIMFFLSPRTGELAGKLGPRLFMGIGPIIAAAGFLIMMSLTAHVDYWTQLFPAVAIFGIGLATTVAPLTSAILGDVLPHQSGIASAVNNAVARVAGLVAIAAVGAVVATQFSAKLDRQMAGKTSADALYRAKQTTLVVTPPGPYKHDQVFQRSLSEASVSAFKTGMLTIAGLMIAGGAVSLVGIRNPEATRVQ